MHLRDDRLGATTRYALVFAVSSLFGWAGAVIAQGTVDASAAEALTLMKNSNCFKCHAAAREKDAPSYKEIAGNYKGKPDAEALVFKQVTTSPKVKVDGKEREHENLKTKNEAEIRNVVRWILSR